MVTDVDELVEDALLGALLRHPDRINQLPWLTFEDFATAPARFVFAELRREHDVHQANPAAPAPTADTVADQLVGRTAPAVHTADLNRMLQAAPVSADPVAYGRIVLEESIRSSVRELGARVADAPVYDPTRITEAATAAVDTVRALRHRWDLTHPAADSPAPVVVASVEPRLGAWLPDQRPERAPIREAERLVVTAAVGGVLDPAAVTAALHPDELHDPAAALAVTAISVLLADQRPVDPVTVAWQQQRLLGERDGIALIHTGLAGPTRAATLEALTVLRADRAHELAFHAPDTLQRDADRHDQPLAVVLAYAETTLVALQQALTGQGLPRVGPAHPADPLRPAAGSDPGGWRWLAEAIDPRLSEDRDWAPLAEALDRSYADGYDVAAQLPRLAGRDPLPAKHPARELHYRLLDDCPAAVHPLSITTQLALDRTTPAAAVRPPNAAPAPVPLRGR